MRIYIVITISITLFHIDVKEKKGAYIKLNYLLQKSLAVFVQNF